MVYSTADRDGGCYATHLTRSHRVSLRVLIITTILLESLAGTGISEPIVGAMRLLLVSSSVHVGDGGLLARLLTHLRGGFRNPRFDVGFCCD
jgi:hypothetical protein